jgi:hypothetical protein
MTTPRESSIAKQSTVYQTINYDIFKSVPGNRAVDKSHVSSLMRRIQEYGNLTPQFPVIVNESMQVIDGQHRLAALRNLGMPVFYEVKEFLNIDSVRLINTGHKNWSWKNFAQSYAELGNNEYSKFLELVADYPYGFNILMFYINGKEVHNRTTTFRDGKLEIDNFLKTSMLLDQYTELTEVADHASRNFAYAAYMFMSRPNYDHEQLKTRLSKNSRKIRSAYYTDDFLDALEEVYLTH